MFRWKSSQDSRDVATEYATRRDFQDIFTEDMADLHLLAFLLTGDQQKSEECFVAGLEDSIAGNPVFREWARSWSKRAIIKNAIKAVAPASGSTTESSATRGNFAWTDDPQQDALIAAVTNLNPFDRFVFVMTVLEGYSLHECAALLTGSLAEVVAAKSRALQRLGSPQVSADSTAGTWIAAVAPGQTA